MLLAEAQPEVVLLKHWSGGARVLASRDRGKFPSDAASASEWEQFKVVGGGRLNGMRCSLSPYLASR